MSQKMGLILMYLNKPSYQEGKRRALRKSLCNECFYIYLHLTTPIITMLANPPLSLTAIACLIDPLFAISSSATFTFLPRVSS